MVEGKVEIRVLTEGQEYLLVGKGKAHTKTAGPRVAAVTDHVKRPQSDKHTAH